MSRAPVVFPAALAMVATLAAMVEGGCFLEQGVASPGEHDEYTCLRSKDIRKDLDRLSVNNTKHLNVVFRESKLPKIEKDTFQKLGTKALGISLIHCGIEDLNEDAFHGLTELKGLILSRNRLPEVKKEWFKDLGKLESLDLNGNLIRNFDPAIFDLIPLIQEFEISENHLRTFDVEAMKTKWPKLKKVGLQWNPFNWLDGLKVIEYSNANPSIVQNSYASVDGIRDTYKVVKECQAAQTQKDDLKELDTCIQGKLAKSVENPKLLEGEIKSSA